MENSDEIAGRQVAEYAERGSLLSTARARGGMKECLWWEHGCGSMDHGPIGHGSASNPARSRRVPDYPKGHRQWPTRDTSADRTFAIRPKQDRDRRNPAQDRATSSK